MSEKRNIPKAFDVEAIEALVSEAATVQAMRCEGCSAERQQAIAQTLRQYALDVATLADTGYQKSGGDELRGILPKMRHLRKFLKSMYDNESILPEGEALFTKAVTDVMANDSAMNGMAHNIVKSMTATALDIYYRETGRPRQLVVPLTAGLAVSEDVPEKLLPSTRAR